MIWIGTSGYNYPEWKGSFYPETMPAAKMLPYYAARFPTVEINYTFYRMPTPKTTEGWLNQAPAAFSYALKAPQRMTHIQRLKDCQDHLRFFCESARVLGPHLGPLLFQLPPNFKADPKRLEDFLALIPDDVRAAFEFRNDSWLTDEVFGLLALMEIQASRLPARTAPDGAPILLTEQNRARWDQLLIRRGLAALQRAFEDRAVEFAQMAQYPPFKTIASEPQYQAIMRQVGLPPT